jgi:hypothetical protein
MPAKPNQTKPNHYFKKQDKKCFKYNKTGGRGRRSEGGKKRKRGEKGFTTKYANRNVEENDQKYQSAKEKEKNADKCCACPDCEITS